MPGQSPRQVRRGIRQGRHLRRRADRLPGRRASACETSVTDVVTEALPSKCAAAKRKGVGKYAGAALRCHVTAAKKELAVDSECLAKAEGKLAAALAKAGTCADGGALRDLVDTACVQATVTVDVAGMVSSACPAPASTSTTTTTTLPTTTTTIATSTTVTTTSTTTTTTTSTSTTTTTLEMDECAAGTDSCDANATCTNTPGGYDCTCNLGFSGDGFTCTALFCIPNVTTRSCYSGPGGTHGVGICDNGLQTCNATGTGYDPACVGQVLPQAEIQCDSVDQDCNGADLCRDGSSQADAGTSCLSILTIAPASTDGVYWIDPNGGSTSDAFQANCDMTTDGGGWTELANFSTGTVAITASTYSGGLGTLASSNRVLACSSLAGLDLTDITMRLSMGTVRDYFRPTSGNDLCGMLGSFTKHRWSASAGGTFVAPAYSTSNLGGSAFNWPLANVPGDGRGFLGFWGGSPNVGGCCHTTASPADGAAWGRAFSLHVREP